MTKIAYSLILIIVLAITLILSLSTVASAQSKSQNKTLELLKKGIQAEEKGEEANADFFYTQAINQVLENRELEVLIVAKTRQAKIKDQQGATRVATKLREEAQAAEKALGEDTNITERCGECKTDTGELGQYTGSGVLKRCIKC
ncbi:hypothetical protein [Chroococcus sp. FPU101]|uniref:hypothetical protein n=1 Tax=Chroococcus sp. FPU101 TaxID=1974212 RepID=UPI001A8CB40D|nr:hypothetical protein [Chroococcus sp. FPU101]GFE69527.1 hypothetical protein CFPU101_21370 [Chroococcus sp. FPU101]